MYLCATIETTDAMKSRPYKFLRNENMENCKFAPTYHGAPQQLFDRQGNPVNEDGKKNQAEKEGGLILTP